MGRDGGGGEYGGKIQVTTGAEGVWRKTVLTFLHLLLFPPLGGGEVFLILACQAPFPYDFGNITVASFA
jgi:hypothetical protein